MLINKGKVTRSMIGIVPENLKDYVKKEKGLEGGALVHIIQPSSPAQTAGIKENDIIVKIGTTPVNSQLDLRNSMLIYAPNTTVPVQLIRDGKTMTVNVKLEPYKKPESQMQSMPMQRGNGQNFDIPKFFDSPDMKQFKQFQDRIRQGQGDDQQDVPAIKGGQAKLGVQVGTTSSELRTQYNIPSSVSGAVVVDVQPGSVASRIGLQEGDVVTQLGDKKIATAEDLTAAMKDMKWGDSTHIKFNHYDKDAVVSQELSVTFK
jgi:serine protease Do